MKKFRLSVFSLPFRRLARFSDAEKPPRRDRRDLRNHPPMVCGRSPMVCGEIGDGRRYHRRWSATPSPMVWQAIGDTHRHCLVRSEGRQAGVMAGKNRPVLPTPDCPGGLGGPGCPGGLGCPCSPAQKKIKKSFKTPLRGRRQYDKLAAVQRPE